MGALSESALKNLSRQAVSELVLDKAPTNQLLQILPFAPVDGHELHLTTVDASGSLASHAGFETEGGTLVDTLPGTATRTYPIKRISSILEVYTLTQDKLSNSNDILQTLIDLKVRAVKDLFCTKLYTGDSGTAGEFSGVNQIASLASNVLGADDNNANGGTVRRGELEAARAMLQVSQPGAEVVFVMHAKGYKHLLTVNYSDVEFVNHPVLGMLPSLAGTPIVIDNFISTTETKGTSNDCTSIYCMALGKGVGVTGIFPAHLQGKEISVRGPIPSETTGTMIYQISWEVAVAAWQTGGLVRIEGARHANTT